MTKNREFVEGVDPAVPEASLYLVITTALVDEAGRMYAIATTERSKGL